MPDREKTITVLELMLAMGPTSFSETEKEAIRAAVELLKEQEAVEPRVSTAEQRCGHCNKVIEMDEWQSCPWCGKRIDWKGWWKKNGTRNQDS